jgi:hypothetical protein
MSEQFKNMGELTAYLGSLEERIKNLEADNKNLFENASSREVVEAVNEEAIERVVLDFLPDSDLLDHSFFKRAFAVWGHFFVANLIISLFFFILYAFLTVIMFGSVFGNLIQSQ